MHAMPEGCDRESKHLALVRLTADLLTKKHERDVRGYSVWCSRTPRTERDSKWQAERRRKLADLRKLSKTAQSLEAELEGATVLERLAITRGKNYVEKKVATRKKELARSASREGAGAREVVNSL